MILNQNQQTEATIMGNVQNNKVGIDRSNIDFITTLLSTNLYSNPIQSFLRETVANGWDSQVEAGTTNIPLLIRLFKDRDVIKVSVRDYGTGLSPERFEETYLNIGSSTKRASNDYIGCMGIGRFSALACSDMVNVKSFYKGICYSYLMYKDGASICIDKLSQTQTDFENGVEVTVSVGKLDNKDHIALDLLLGLKALSYFDKIYIEDADGILEKDEVNNFNKRKLHSFKSFKVISVRPGGKCRLLMGTVSYPIETSLVKSILGVDAPIDIVCKIGEVDVTPNREQLLYNTRTTETIKRGLTAAKEELAELLKMQVSGNFNNVEEWYSFIENDEYNLKLYEFEIDGLKNQVNFLIPKAYYQDYGLSNAMTINGEALPPMLERVYKNFLSIGFPPNLLTYSYFGDKFHLPAKHNYYTLNSYIEAYEENRLRILHEPYKPITKQYLSQQMEAAGLSHWSRWNAIWFVNPTHFKNAALKLWKTWDALVPDCYEAKSFVIKDFKANYLKSIPTFENSDVPQAFKDAAKVVSTGPRAVARKCVVYALESGKIYDRNLGFTTIITNSNTFDSDTIGQVIGTVIYGEKDNPILRNLFALFHYVLWNKGNLHLRNYTFVEVAATNLKILERHKNCVYVNSLLTTPNATIRKIATAWHIYQIYANPYTNIRDGGSSELLRLAGIEKLYSELNMASDIARSISNMNDGVVKTFTLELCKLYIGNNWLYFNTLAEIEAHPEVLALRKMLVHYEFNIRDLLPIATNAFLSQYRPQMAKRKVFTKVKKTFHELTQHS